MANQLLLELDVVLIGALSTAGNAGIYAAAYRIPNALNTLIALSLLTALPHITQTAGNDSALFAATLRRSRRVAAIAGVTSALVLSAPAAAAVPLIFGAEFRSGGASAAVLTLGVCVALMAAPLHPLYLSRGSDKSYGLALTVAAALNLILNVLFIPAFGLPGAASATLASQIAIYVALLLMTRRLTTGP